MVSFEYIDFQDPSSLKFHNKTDINNQYTFSEISDVQEKTMKYDCPQCDNVYYEKKEWIEHIEEIHVKQEKGNCMKIRDWEFVKPCSEQLIIKYASLNPDLFTTQIYEFSTYTDAIL